MSKSVSRVSQASSAVARHKIVATTLAVAAVTGVGLVGCGGSSTAGTSPTPSPTGALYGVAGQISAESGSTWTVTNKAGTQYTVTVTSQTQFGTKQYPATQQQFKVGSSVRVRGTGSGTSVTATRVDPGRAPQSPATPTPSS
ncbi:MAG: DUF5666 domain-containing protein [Candidatus Dormibacteraceae bacterium]